MRESTIRRHTMFFTLAAISMAAVWVTFTGYIEFSTFAVAIAKVTLAVILFWFIDNTLLSEINTTEELQHENISYALFLVGLFICLGLLISTA